MSSIGQSILMALTVTVNKYASSNVQAVHRKQPTLSSIATNTNVDFGRRGLLLSTAIAATQVPDSRTELLKSMHNSCFVLIVVYVLVVLLANSNNVVVMKLSSEYLKKTEENKEKNDKEVNK